MISTGYFIFRFSLLIKHRPLNTTTLKNTHSYPVYAFHPHVSSGPESPKSVSLHPISNFVPITSDMYNLFVTLHMCNHFSTPSSALSTVLFLLLNLKLTFSLHHQSSLFTSHIILKHYIFTTKGKLFDKKKE